MIFHEKKNHVYIFKAYKRSKLFKKMPMTITLKLNMIQTWNMRKNVHFWKLYCVPLTTQFRPKMDLVPFGNEDCSGKSTHVP